MTASISTTEQIRSRAWFLHAEFHVAGHPQIADIPTKRIIPEYVRNIIAARAPYFNKHLKALALLSISMPTDMSSLCNREVVPVFGILYDSRLVFENTVQAIFRGFDGLCTTCLCWTKAASLTEPASDIHKYILHTCARARTHAHSISLCFFIPHLSLQTFLSFFFSYPLSSLNYHYHLFPPFFQQVDLLPEPAPQVQRKITQSV